MKAIALGTALWGWGIDRATAHALLNAFAAAGGRIVDTATNYPINRQPEDHGLALRWIAEWIAANPNATLSVLAKFGAQDNTGGAVTRLDPESIFASEALLRAQLGTSLAAMAIHWDNRGDAAAIADTVGAMAALRGRGLAIGFSGVRHPQLYRAAAPGLAGEWWIQVKENLATAAARGLYAPHFPQATYLAYGINMGGVKLDPGEPGNSLEIRGLERPSRQVEVLARFLASDHRLRPRPGTLNELALAYCHSTLGLSGAIVGPRNPGQLAETLRFWEALQSEPPDRMTSIISGLARELR